MSTAFQTVSEPQAKSGRKTPDEIVEDCFVRTAEALSGARAASDEQIFTALQKVREGHAKGVPMDILETLARVLGHDEEHIGPEITDLSDMVAATLNPAPSSIPFISKLIAPSAFYDSFDALHELGKSLLTPVVYAEDTDAIGTASINPVAAALLGDEIYYAVGKRFGIKPFITVARMEYESWAFLCRKHFEL